MATAKDNMPKQTKVQEHPVCVDGHGLKDTPTLIERDQSSARTMAANNVKISLQMRELDKMRRRKRANVLIFRFQNGRKLRKIFVRGKRLLSVLSNKNVHVTGAKFKHLKLLPSRSLVASRFTISVERLRSQCAWQGRQTAHNDKPNQSQLQWIEIERNRTTSERNSTPNYKASTQKLRRLLAEDLDSSVDMDSDTSSSSGLSLERSKIDSISSDELINTDQQGNFISKNSVADDIDDIFGALGDLK